MAQAWLALGANIGDPPAQVREAVERLDRWPGIRVVAQSGMLLTKPWGKTDQPDFSNMVVEVETTLRPARAARRLPRRSSRRWAGSATSAGDRGASISMWWPTSGWSSTSSGCTCRTATRTSATSYSTPLREIAPEVAEWIVETESADGATHRESSLRKQGSNHQLALAGDGSRFRGMHR